MSCLLQRPSISFYYSQSPTTSSGGLVMESPNAPNESREPPRMDQSPTTGRPEQYYIMPAHTTNAVDYHRRPEVYLSCDTSGHIKDAEATPTKNEPFFPQQNSPVERFPGEHAHQNGFSHRSPRYIEDHSEFTTIPRTGDAFGLNLKLELENYVNACENGTGEQFRKFRGPVSPTSSLSCSTSSLLSLAPTTGVGCPSRRHSFSATVQSPEAGGFTTITGTIPHPSGGAGANSTYYRQRSHTYSSTSSKTHPYPINKRQAGWHTYISAQNDLHDRIGGLNIKPDDHNDDHAGMDEDFDAYELSGDCSRDVSRKGSIDDSKAYDPLNILFVGPFGKKRKMVHERRQSIEGSESHPIPMDDQSSLDASILSPVGSDFGTLKEKVEDIVEEDEYDDSVGIEVRYDESNEPLNLCVSEDSETMERVGRLNLNNNGSMCSSQSSLNSGMRPRAMSGGNLLSPPDGSVLRRQLLGLTETIGPTPPQYQTRDRSASMSVIVLRNRLSVIQETMAALNPRRTLSPPPTNRSNGVFPCASRATSTASINSSTTSEVSTSKRTLECQDCGKVFSQLRNYRYHRSRHEGTSQFACTCPVCHKQFNDRGYLSSHLKIHKNAKEYQCEFCEKSFNQRVAYNMHVRIHTGVKPHQCTKCDKAFSRRMLLKQHERTHTGERPYKCEICGKAFADRSNMLLHQRLHTGLRPFHCDICGKSFSKNHHLKTHLNHHAGIKPYQCSKCNAAFSQSSNMKTHFRKCTAAPIDENGGVPGTVTQESKNIPVKGNQNPATVPYMPTKSYNFQFEDRPKHLIQSDTYRLFSEEDHCRNAFQDGHGINTMAFSGFRVPQHVRSSSPFEGLSTLSLSSSAPAGGIHMPTMLNHLPSPELLYPRAHVSPSSQPFDNNLGIRNPFPHYPLDSPPRIERSLQIPIKVSPRISPQDQRLQEHSPHHHIQQSMQHLQLSPQPVHQPGFVHDEGRARANTWSTNRPAGLGKRKLPL